MRAGDLRDRIEIRRRSRIEDGQGGHTEGEILVLSCWAEVTVPRAKDGVVAQKDVSIRSHEVKIRYSAAPDIADVVLWQGRRLSVLSTRPVERGAGLILECETERRLPCPVDT